MKTLFGICKGISAGTFHTADNFLMALSSTVIIGAFGITSDGITRSTSCRTGVTCIEQIHCRDLLQSPCIELTIHDRNLYMALAQSLPSYHPIHGGDLFYQSPCIEQIHCRGLLQNPCIELTIHGRNLSHGPCTKLAILPFNPW